MRWILAGPLTVILAMLVTVAMPLWLPQGSAGIDHIVFPVVLFPLTWALLFFYVVLESRIVRCTAVFAGAITVNAALVASSLAGGTA